MNKGEFQIRPIESKDLDYVPDWCWENRQTQMRLLELQEILGFGAWEGDVCVGLLHCYSVTLPQWDDSNFPGYGRKRLISWPLGWPLLAAKGKGLQFNNLFGDMHVSMWAGNLMLHLQIRNISVVGLVRQC